MEQQELFMQAQQIGGELQRVVQHRKAIDEELSTTNNFLSQLSSFPGKEGKILSPLSHGIFARANVENRPFLVQVGAGIVVERSLEEIRELLEKNVSQLMNASKQLQAQEEFYTSQLQHLVSLAEGNENAG